MNKATKLIDRLISTNIPNYDIDWEQLLRINYCVLLDSGKNYVDVGGNLGSHANCFISDMEASRLSIFEPIPDMLDFLRARFSHIPYVNIFPYALSDSHRQSTFHWKPNAPAESGLALKNIYSDGRRDNVREIRVDVRRLDDVDLGFIPDFIKVDIEGGEIDMLNGAPRLIGDARPLISVEYGFVGYEAFGHTAAALPNWAVKSDYVIFDLFGNAFDPVEFLGAVNRYYWDYLLIPREKIGVLQLRIDILRRITLPVPLTKWRDTNLDIISRI